MIVHHNNEVNKATTSIEIMASSKPIIDDYELNKGYIVKYNLGFSKLEDYYYHLVKHLFTMPYIYEVSGLHSGAFYEYLAQHMDHNLSIKKGNPKLDYLRL